MRLRHSIVFPLVIVLVAVANESHIIREYHLKNDYLSRSLTADEKFSEAHVMDGKSFAKRGLPEGIDLNEPAPQGSPTTSKDMGDVASSGGPGDTLSQAKARPVTGRTVAERKDINRANSKRHYEKNKPLILEKRRKWYEDKRESIKEYRRQKKERDKKLQTLSSDAERPVKLRSSVERPNLTEEDRPREAIRRRNAGYQAKRRSNPVSRAKDIASCKTYYAKNRSAILAQRKQYYLQVKDSRKSARAKGGQEQKPANEEPSRGSPDRRGKGLLLAESRSKRSSDHQLSGSSLVKRSGNLSSGSEAGTPGAREDPLMSLANAAAKERAAGMRKDARTELRRRIRAANPDDDVVWLRGTKKMTNREWIERDRLRNAKKQARRRQRPEVREECRVRSRQFYKENVDLVRARNRAYYLNNRDAILAKTRQNPSKPYVLKAPRPLMTRKRRRETAPADVNETIRAQTQPTRQKPTTPKATAIPSDSPNYPRSMGA